MGAVGQSSSPRRGRGSANRASVQGPDRHGADTRQPQEAPRDSSSRRGWLSSRTGTVTSPHELPISRPHRPSRQFPCLGTMNFGMQTDEETSHQIMDRGLELGLNFFDTANVYGDGRGLTEQIVGRWFAQGADRRERVVVATKVYNSRSQWPNESKLSAFHIRKACEDSLRRLQTDHIDLYQMHHVDRERPGRRSGRPWISSWPRARSSTSVAATLPPGTS